jgi:uncharacterized protein YaiE (UPF0345 family)
MKNAFAGVTVEIKANIYFNGNVTSRTILFLDGSKKTLGIILPGTYEFSVGAKEEVEIVAGSAEILLPQAREWIKVAVGDLFTVATNCKYQIRSQQIVEYVCSYFPQ